MTDEDDASQGRERTVREYVEHLQGRDPAELADLRRQAWQGRSQTPDEGRLVDEALARAGITVGRRVPRPRMTRAKAERLVAALAAVRECEDAPDDPAYDDVRASVEPWL